MTKSNITSSNYINHTTFGGVITIEDFNTHSPNKKRISNQIDANNLPETIKNEQAKKDEEQNYKSLTLEQLRE